MINYKKSALIQLGGFYVNSAFAIISGFVLVPLYFKYFSVGTYGSWLASGNILGLVTLIEGGFTIVLTQRLSLFYSENKQEQFAKTASSGVLINSIIAFLIVIIVSIIYKFISIWVNASLVDHIPIRQAFFLAGIGVAFSMIYSALFSIVRSWHDAIFSSVLNLAASILGIVMTIICLVNHFGIVSIAIGLLVKSTINFIGLLFYIVINWKSKVDSPLSISSSITLSLIKDTLPMFFSNFVNTLVSNSKELILSISISPAIAALFALTGKLFGLIISIINPIVFSSFPALSSYSFDKKKFKEVFTNLSSLHSFISITALGVCLIVNKTFICYWIGCDKYGGNLLSILFCISYLFQVRFVLYTNSLSATGMFRSTAFVSIADICFRVSALGLLVFLKIKIEPFIMPLIEFVSYLCWTLITERILLNQLNVATIKSKLLFYKSFFFLAFFVISLIILLISFSPGNIYFVIINLFIFGILIWLFMKSEALSLFYKLVSVGKNFNYLKDKDV